MVSIHDRDDVRAIYAKRTAIDQFPELLQFIFPGSVVLDVGCGPGSITLDVARIAKEGAVYGIDSAKAAIDNAVNAATQLSVKNVEFLVGDACELPFENDTFDLTYSHAVIDWIETLVKALEEQCRVLKSGGGNALYDC